MWQSKGRSGYGDSTIGGDYDSWNGVSPNGRQYKNEATMETRDLSGADYWHLRKQNRPTEEIPLELHMLKNGKANINAYADPVVVKKTTKVSIKQRILPQLARLEKLQAEILELEIAYKSGEVSPEDYTVLRNIAFAKKERAEILYKRAISVKPRSQLEDDTEILDDSPLSCEEYAQENVIKDRDGDGHRGEPFAWLRDENSLKKILQRGCKVVKGVVHFSQKAKSYWNELKEV